jgi:hypothetical protein
MSGGINSAYPEYGKGFRLLHRFIFFDTIATHLDQIEYAHKERVRAAIPSLNLWQAEL